jgi:hypothetical protein
MLQDYRERERLARETVRKALKNAPWLFTKEGSQRHYRAHMERESIEKLVALAREGDREAAEILQNRGRVARSLGTIVPTCFQEFVWEWFLDGPPKAKSGTSPKDIGLKHLTIALLVRRVIRDHGFPEYSAPERRDDPDRPMTACWLVGEEVGLSESQVEKIWRDRKEMILRQEKPTQ